MTKNELIEAINATIAPNGQKAITAESLANLLIEMVNATPDGGVTSSGNIHAVIYSGVINADGTATFSDEEKEANASVYTSLMSGSIMPVVYKQDLTQVLGYTRVWSNVVADVYPEYGVQIKASYVPLEGSVESQVFVLMPDGTLDFDAV